MGGCGDKSQRCLDDVKKCRRTEEKVAKADLAKRKHPGTGGGPRHKGGVYTDVIAAIFGDQTALVDGVQGGVDAADNGLFTIATDGDSEGVLTICLLLLNTFLTLVLNPISIKINRDEISSNQM